MRSLFSFTFCISSVGVVLRQLLQVVFKQHLVSRDSLHRLQHVMLKSQTATDLLALCREKQKRINKYLPESHEDICSPQLVHRLYLNLLNYGLKLRRTVSPLFQNFHGLVEILHIFSVHFKEGCEFLQNVPNPRRGRPVEKKQKELVTL